MLPPLGRDSDKRTMIFHKASLKNDLDVSNSNYKKSRGGIFVAFHVLLVGVNRKLSNIMTCLREEFE